MLSTRRFLRFALVLSLCTVPLGGAAAQQVRYIDPDPATGSSAGVVVSDAWLAHTAQFLPLDAQGHLAGANTTAQIDQVMENLRRALSHVGAGLDDLVKVNVYARSTAAADQVRAHFARTFSGEARPAVSYVVGDLPHPEAQVAMDAVAVAAPQQEKLTIYHVPGLYGAAERGHVSVVPHEALIYISGQVASGDDLIAAMRETLEASHSRMAYLGLSNYDVVQVKTFLTEIDRAGEIACEIAAYYREKPAPPMVFAEWTHPGSDIEIELIAAKTPQPEAQGDAVTYTTPPGLSASPHYSRVAEINRGSLLYLSGLYGDPAKDAKGQLQEIYDTMAGVLEKAGSDFDHLLKATYYLDNWDAPRIALGEIRPVYYKPDRPPTSSLIPVPHVGKEGGLVTIDMIGVVPPK